MGRMGTMLKSFLEGMGSVLNLYPNEMDPEIQRMMSQSDAEAIRSDWEAVGGYLRTSMDQHAEYLNAEGRREQR